MKKRNIWILAVLLICIAAVVAGLMHDDPGSTTAGVVKPPAAQEADKPSAPEEDETSVTASTDIPDNNTGLTEFSDNDEVFDISFEDDIKDNPSLAEKIVAYDNTGKKIKPSEVDEDTYSGYIFTLKKELTPSQCRKAGIKDIGHGTYSAGSLKDIAKVAKAKDIGYIEPNYTYEVLDWSPNPNDPYYTSGVQYSCSQLNAESAWDMGYYGQGVLVAVIDTGMYSKHEDIDYSHVRTGRSYVEGNMSDGFGHGTMVAGIIVCKQNNKKGIAGLAPGADVMPMKVFDKYGNTYGDDIAQAIYDSVEAGADVINMSLGGPAYNITMRKACDYATKSGVIVIAAAGNDGTDANEYPAAYDSVIGVASVDEWGYRSSFSQMGRAVDVAASGDSMVLPYNASKGDYVYSSGTSFASPCVAALAALVRSADPDCTTSEFLDLLKVTSSNYTENSGTKWTSGTGYGIVNFGAVMSKVEGIKSSLDDCMVYLETDSLPYTGAKKTPEVGVSYYDMPLKKGTSYTVTYKDNVEPGTATVTVKGKGDFTGTRTLTFNIYDPYITVSAHDGYITAEEELTLIGGNQIPRILTGESDVSVTLSKNFLEKIKNKGLRLESASCYLELSPESLETVINGMEEEEITISLSEDGNLSYGGLPLYIPAEVSLKIPEGVITPVAVSDNEPVKGSVVNDEFRFVAEYGGTYSIVSADSFVKPLIKKVTPKIKQSVYAKGIKIKVTAGTTAIKDYGYTVKFKYYRGKNTNEKYSVKKTTTSKSYVHTGLKDGNWYSYKVRAYVYDRDGNLIGKSKTSNVIDRWF